MVGAAWFGVNIEGKSINDILFEFPKVDSDLSILSPHHIRLVCEPEYVSETSFLVELDVWDLTTCQRQSWVVEKGLGGLVWESQEGKKQFPYYLNGFRWIQKNTCQNLLLDGPADHRKTDEKMAIDRVF